MKTFRLMSLGLITIAIFVVQQLHAKNIFIDKGVKDFPTVSANSPLAFHLISHGRPGELFLNGKWRNANEITAFLKTKHLIHSHTRQLNIYGCEFGKGIKGRRAVATIRQALKIDIAASDNITGKHGDWLLEVGKSAHLLQITAYPYDLQLICRDTTFTPVTTGWSGATGQPSYDPPNGCIDNSGLTTNGNITDFYGAGFNTEYDSPIGYLWTRSLGGLSPSQMYRVRITIRSYTNSTDLRNGYFQDYNLAGRTGTFTAHGGTTIVDQTNYYFIVSNLSSLSFSGTIIGAPWDSCQQVVDYYLQINVDMITNITTSYTAPTLPDTTKTNICPATNSNLTGLAMGCNTASTTLQWHTTNTGYSNATRLTNITSVNNGKYYAICFNATRNCYSNPSLGLAVNNLPCPPLPIELKSINATWEKNDAIISWITANENNMSHYSIEKSMDGTNFLEIGQVNSIGDHATDHTYIFRDPDVKYQSLNGLFYRLKQIDKDGRYKTSTVISLPDNNRQTTAYIYPNPFSGNYLNFTYQSDIQQNMQLFVEIVDIYGRRIYQTKTNIHKGKNLIAIPFTNITAGSYFLKYSSVQNNIDGVARIIKN